MNAMRSYTDVRIVLGLLALLWCFAPSQASGEVQAVTNGRSGSPRQNFRYVCGS
jgi:hypothetical protein